MRANLRLVFYAIIVMLSPSTSGGQGNHLQGTTGGNDSTQVKEWLVQVDKLLTKNPGEAVLVAKKALLLSEKIQYLAGQANSNVRLANVYLSKNEQLTALSFLENAKQLLLRLSDDTQLAKVYKSIGDIYSFRSNLRAASDNYREASILFRKTGQMKLLNECQDAMGNIAIESGRTTGAISIFRRSLIVKTNLNDNKGIIQTNLVLSKLYLTEKNYDSALFFNKEVKRLAGDDKESQAAATIDELIIFSFQGKLKEANEVRREAELLVSQQSNPSNRIKLLAAITNYYMAQKNNVMVEKYFDSTAALISDSRSVEMAASGLQLLADMSSQNEDYKTAYRMMKSMNRYKDQFRNENMERISAEMKNYAEAGLKEKEIEYLNLVNKLKQEQLSKEELRRMALLRENILKDSSLAKQELLMAAMQTESNLRNDQLTKEKELSQSLSRENELKQKMLNGERRNKRLLWLGIGALAMLGMVIFYQYRKQRIKNSIINKQSAELEVLNKEIHHRVKNNLQVISSMLDLQSQTLNDDKATAIIKEGIQRVQSMAFIHQNLYQGIAVNGVNMNEYIKILSTHLFQTYNIRTDKIQLHTQIEDLNLHTDTAIPLGMILNELISNSLKYAFKGKEKGDIWVTMKKNANELLLQVKDNGVGLPAGFNPDNTSSFGFEIIKAFSQKMKARMNIENSNGADIQIIISKFKTTN